MWSTAQIFKLSSFLIALPLSKICCNGICWEDAAAKVLCVLGHSLEMMCVSCPFGGVENENFG